MQQNVTELARKWRTPRGAEQEVVAAISSAEGKTNLDRGGGHYAVGVGVALLALVAGAALGYSGMRWLGPLSSWRRLGPEPWQRLADALRPIVEAAAKARIPT